MDVDGFETAIRTRMGLNANDPVFTDAVLLVLINAALQRVTSEEDWDWNEKSETIATAASDQDEAVAADYMRTLGLYEADGKPLERVDFDMIQNLTTAESANVRYFCVSGTQIFLRPVPNGIFNLTHRYIATEPALASGSDTPVIPTQYHDAVADYATYLAYKRVGNPNEAGVFLEEYARWIALMQRRGHRYADSRGGGVTVTQQAEVPA